jgi:hypothetical protein
MFHFLYKASILCHSHCQRLLRPFSGKKVLTKKGDKIGFTVLCLPVYKKFLVLEKRRADKWEDGWMRRHGWIREDCAAPAPAVLHNYHPHPPPSPHHALYAWTKYL